MTNSIFGERITQLRLKKGVSEYKMSLELGQCRTYINMIANGKSLPSMKAFLAICEYFEITPEQFFMPYLNEKTEWLFNTIQELTDEDIDALRYFVDALAAKKKLAQKKRI